MTAINTITKTDKATLLSIVGKPVHVSSFRQPEGYYPLPSGRYFIDSVIFHHPDSVEVGISEYDPAIPLEDFDIDKAHISYFNLDDVDIVDPGTKEQPHPLINQSNLPV